MTDISPSIKFEMAHILFMDIVGFSLLSMEKQAQHASELRSIVRRTAEFKQAEECHELLCLDTGDGMALVFMRNPVAPIQCAMEIAQELPSYLKLRMGIHSGHISRVADINGRENITGSGINMAQRVMDCGDADHILLSARDAQDLGEHENWASCLFDLGECEIKHGAKLHVYNFYSGKIGNFSLPKKLSATNNVGVQKEARAEYSGAQVLSPVEATHEKVAIIYKRDAKNDKIVRDLLEARLTAEGYEVFYDLHMPIGVNWAQEIDRQIHTAHAVITLLSAESIQSDMLEEELHTAHVAAQKQNGKPRLLPVRIGDIEVLPDALATILNPLQYALWEDEKDNARIADEVMYALRHPPEILPVRSGPSMEAIGGAMPLDSNFYIERPVDSEFKTALSRRDSIILLKGARQMGKTSLLARGLRQAREAGAKVVLTDFQTFNESQMASPDTLFLSIAATIADQLDMDINPKKSWDPDLGPNMNLEYFLRRKVLKSMTEPLVWGLDEVDRLFAYPYCSEVFGLFRSWHNRRSLEPDSPWSRLTLAIAYATEAHLFITDLNQSPFNVGTRLALEDFTCDQIAELSQRYGDPLKDREEIQRFYRLVSGQPYLVRRGLDDMAAKKIDLTTLEAQADRDEGIFGDHLRRILISLSRDNAMTEEVRTLLRGGACSSLENFFRLRSAGIIVGGTPQDAQFRSELYKSYLAHHLL